MRCLIKKEKEQIIRMIMLGFNFGEIVKNKEIIVWNLNYKISKKHF
jgi:hypothetical protein